MNPDTLIQRGNAGYSKQQKQLRQASSVPATSAPAADVSSPDKQYNAGGGVINPYGTAPVSPNTPITSAAMAPTAPISLPTTVQPTAASGVAGAIEASNKSVLTAQQKQDALVAEQAKLAETSQGAMDKALDRMMGINTEVSQAASTIDRTAEDEARKRSDELVSQMESNSLATRRQIEALQKNNPQGIFGGALQDEVNRIERDNEIKNADLAVQQLAALRSYERLNAIADRQLELKLEPLRLEAKNMELFYNANKDKWSKADDRIFAAAKDKADKELSKATAIETQLSELKKNVAQYAGANAGTVLAQLSKIDTSKPGAVDKALAIAGKYQSDPLDRAIKNAQLSKLNADSAKTRSDASIASATAVSAEAQSWADSISSGKAKLSDVPKNLKSSVVAAMNAQPANTQVINTLNDKLAVIKEITDNTGFFGGMRKTVGPNALARKGYLSFNTFTGKDQDFVAAVNQLTNQETLTTLLDLKKAGGTLGALSEGEGKLLREAASKINTWKKEDKDGNVYYKVSEASFLKEINTLKKYTERAIKDAAGGSVATEDDYLDTVTKTLSNVNSPYGAYLDE